MRTASVRRESISRIRLLFNRKHLRRLSLFLAKYDPDGTERRELHIYEELVNNDVQALRSRISASSGSNENPWPWRKRKTAEEWLEFYLDYEESIDKKAEKAKQNWAAEEAEQVAGPSQPRSTPKPPSSSKKTIPSTPSRRTAFDENDDYNLMQFLAIECPEPKGRKSINTYTKLFDNVRAHTVSLLISYVLRFPSSSRTSGPGQVAIRQRPGESGIRRGTTYSTLGSNNIRRGSR